MRILFFTVLALLISSTSVSAHKSHTSVAEVEWNDKSQRFEVAMRLHIADIEDAISVQNNERFRIEGNDSASVDLRKFVADRFSIQAQSAQQHRLHWVGVELELHEAWLYFEVELKAATTKAATKAGSSKVEHWDDLFQPSNPATVLRPDPATGLQKLEVADLKELKIKNTLLFEVQPEQKNVVSVTIEGSTDSVVLHPAKPQDVLSVVSKRKWQIGR